MSTWYIKVRWHLWCQRVWLIMLRDEYKTKYPDGYALADRKWRYHANKALGIMQNHLKDKAT